MADKKPEIKHIGLEDTIAPLTIRRIHEPLAYKSLIQFITVHFPDGCWGLVRVMAGHGGKQMILENTFLAINDATLKFPFNELADGNEEVWTVIENHDGVWPHRISVVFETADAREAG